MVQFSEVWNIIPYIVDYIQRTTITQVTSLLKCKSVGRNSVAKFMVFYLLDLGVDREARALMAVWPSHGPQSW